MPASSYYTIITDAGLAAVADAIAGGYSLTMDVMAVGDGAPSMTGAETALVNEVWRAPVNTVFRVAGSPSLVAVEAIIPAGDGGFTIREAGVYTLGGELFAIALLPDTYKPAITDGSSKDMVLRLLLEIDTAAEVTLTIDPNVVVATREYVDSREYVPAGVITQWPRETPPAGWLELDGSLLSRSSYAALYAVLGTRYGAGDGSTTFALPDMRGRFVRAWDHGAGRDPDAATRTNRGDGQTGDAVGTLQTGQIQSHAHTITGSLGLGTDIGGTIQRDGNSAEWTDDGAAAGGNETRPLNIAAMYIIKY